MICTMLLPAEIRMLFPDALQLPATPESVVLHEVPVVELVLEVPLLVPVVVAAPVVLLPFEGLLPDE